MPDSFNLTDDPWLDCELPDGSILSLSTRDALKRAHEVRALIGDPLVSAAVHRHLLAVVHRVVDGPASVEAWIELFETERFDPDAIDGYLDRVRDRMDLFHPATPFAQARGLADKGFNVDPIDKLGFERSKWGGARALFQHRSEGYRATMTPAEAARALLAHHAFATGGLVKKPGEPTSATAAPLVRSAVVLVRGPTLFRTLVSNLLIYRPDSGKPVLAEGDAPAWEQPPPPRDLSMSKEPKVRPKGWLDLLTWESRRLELVREGDRVTGFVRAVGKGLPDDPPQDPMVAYKLHDKRGWLPVGLDPNRVFWRDANALFTAAEGETKSVQRPAALDLLSRAEVIDVVGLDAELDLDLLGLSAEKSRLDMIRAEHLRALARVFDDGAAAREVEGALENAYGAIKALGRGLYKYSSVALSPGDRTPDPKDVSALVKSFGAHREAWSALGPHFEQLLFELGARDYESARHRFADACVDVARARFRAATESADRSGRWLEAEVRGRAALHFALRALVPSRSPTPTPTPAQETAR